MIWIFFFSFSWLFCICPFLEGYPQGSSQEVRNDARFFSKRGNLIKGIDYTDEVREKIRDNEVTQKHITECFISLFLHNKVPQTFVAQNNNNHFFFIVIFRSFGIGWVWLEGSHLGYLRQLYEMVVEVRVILKAYLLT